MQRRGEGNTSVVLAVVMVAEGKVVLWGLERRREREREREKASSSGAAWKQANKMLPLPPGSSAISAQ